MAPFWRRSSSQATPGAGSPNSSGMEADAGGMSSVHGSEPGSDARSAGDDLFVDVGGGDVERVEPGRPDAVVFEPLPQGQSSSAAALRAEDLSNKLLRMTADFDNFRRRNAAARAEAADEG